MNAHERIDAAVRLRALPNGEVPVAPLLITYIARLAGMKQAEIFSSVQAWQQAIDKAVSRIGAPDMGFALWPRDVPFSESMKFKLPGRELDEDALFQLVEEEVMKRGDYERILRTGYDGWYYDYMAGLDPRRPSGWRGRASVVLSFIQMGLRIRSNVKHLEGKGISPAFYSAGYPPFDFFSLARSLRHFCIDLHDCPELIQKACEASLQPILNTIMQPLMMTHGKRVCIYPMRSSATFISPATFEKMALEHLKRMAEFFVAKGITPIIHCDANWTPLLKHFRELPRASCILELDQDTDLFKAKEILGNWMCLKGNVPPYMLAFGEIGEVEAYCEKLVCEVGRDGGFILGSGCEVPLNAKPENVEAMIRVGRRQSRAQALAA